MGIAYKFFWQAIARGGKIAPGELKTYITYSSMMAVLGSILISYIIVTVSDKIKSGIIVSDLQKPLDFQKLTIADSFGAMLGNFVMEFIPKFIILKLALDIYLPSSLFNAVCFFVSLIFGYFILTAMDYLISLVAFYLVEAWAFMVMKNLLVGFFSGLLFPLWLYPDKIKFLIDILPFKYIFFSPINIYLGKYNAIDTMYSFVFQVLWIAGLVIMGKLLTKVAIRQITIAGG
jgi:ABC-2 type transport system permease protein